MSQSIVYIRAAAAVFLLMFLGYSPAQREASAAQVRLDVGVSNPTMLAGEKSINHVRISLKGFELPDSKHRPPVNVAIVIDNSGSMSGQKIVQARDAAIAAVNRLRDDDIVSVVLYNSSVEVIVPATKATDRVQIIKKIKRITAGGSTAVAKKLSPASERSPAAVFAIRSRSTISPDCRRMSSG